MSTRQIIVFGYGPYGQEVARSMRNIYEDIVIVDQFDRHLQAAKDDGFTQVIQINIHQEDAFGDLNIHSHATAFCAFEDEAHNVYLTISLRAEYDHITIVAFGETKESHHKFMMAGANKVIIVQEAGANLLFNKLVNPSVSMLFEDIFYYKNSLNMGELVIGQHSVLVGSTLKTLMVQNPFHVVVLGLVDLEIGKNFIFATTGHDHTIDPGDAVVILGPQEEIDRFKKEYA